MSTKTITSLSVKDTATKAVALYATRLAADENRKASLATLDTLPKTKTGKDTKAVKEAKAKVEATYNEARTEHDHACRDFDRAYRLAVIETNRMHANAFLVDKALAKHGFYPDENLTGKLVETTTSIRQYNKGIGEGGEGKAYDGRDKVHGHIHYMYGNERVYISGNGGAKNLYLVVKFNKDNYTYRFSYFGYEPKLTAFGLAFFRNYCVYGMSMFDHDLLSDLRVNFSSIGSEFGPEAVERLSNLCTLVNAAETLMNEAPFACTRMTCVEYNTELMEAIANGETLSIVRRTVQPKDCLDRKGRFNVVVPSKEIDEAGLDADQAILAVVDVNQPLEHVYEDDSE